MCGIILAKRKNQKPVAKFIEDAYKMQKSRGSEGFGYIAIENGFARVERSEVEDDILKKLRKEKASEILFHHRMPTSTDNHDFATHPIHVSNKELEFDYLVVHNGVVRNCDNLKTKHEKLGFEYSTEHDIETSVNWKGGVKNVFRETKFNDSESLAIEFARYIEGLSDTMNFEGTASIIAYQVTKEGSNVVKLIWGHNTGNPLYQEETAIKKGSVATIRSFSSGVAVPTGRLFIKDYETNVIDEVIVDVGQTYKDYKYTPDVGFGYGRGNYSLDDYDDTYWEDMYGAGRRSHRDNTGVTIPSLPAPSTDDFTDISGTEFYQMKRDIELRITNYEEEVDFWRGEIKEAKGAELTAMREELKNSEIELNKAMSEYDIWTELYGLESPYSNELSWQ